MVTMLASPQLRHTASRFFSIDETPTGFEWVKRLSGLHYRLFVVELYQALANALIHQEDGEALRQVLEDWQATAEVDSNPRLIVKLRAPRSTKKYREWKPPSE